MKLICVSTGSEQGNSYLLQSADGRYIVLDCGVSYKAVEKSCGFDTCLIDFALCSHVHEDHLKGAKGLLHNGIDVYSNQEVAEKIRGVKCLKEKSAVRMCGWKVIPFIVPHTHNTGEECLNYAYLIEKNGEKLLYMTDWMYCRYDLSPLNINHFLIAINYTELDVEEAGKKNHVLHGHSSLETALEFLKTSMTDACKTVIACHLSSRNADESKIVRELTELVPETVNVVIAKKGMTLTL